jgi:GDP-L-fucose synthase
MRNIFLAGSKGMVGSSLERLLLSKPDVNLLSTSRDTLDLLDFNSVKSFF